MRSRNLAATLFLCAGCAPQLGDSDSYLELSPPSATIKVGDTQQLTDTRKRRSDALGLRMFYTGRRGNVPGAIPEGAFFVEGAIGQALAP
jgi:hypothetical protein